MILGISDCMINPNSGFILVTPLISYLNRQPLLSSLISHLSPESITSEMVSLSTSSSSSRRSIFNGEYVDYPAARSASKVLGVPAPRCGCGFAVTIQTSMTPKNPGRRFYTCHRQKGSRQMRREIGCGIWEWIDLPFPDQANFVLNSVIADIGQYYSEKCRLEMTMKDLQADLEKLKYDFNEAKGFVEHLSDLDVEKDEKMKAIVSSIVLFYAIILMYLLK